jgi:hypothetical protein
MFSFISKKISDKKFCTWDIICDYFIHHHFRPIVRLYFLNYSDNFSIIFYCPSNVFFLIFKTAANTSVTFFIFISNVNMSRQLLTSNLQPF